MLCGTDQDKALDRVAQEATDKSSQAKKRKKRNKQKKRAKKLEISEPIQTQDQLKR